MDFKSFAAECLHNQQQADRLRTVVERDWYVDDGNLLVRVGVHVWRMDDVRVSLNVSRWKSQPGTYSCDRHGNRLGKPDGYYDFEAHPLYELTAAQLRMVAACREILEQWVRGDIAELPMNAVL